MSSTKTEHTLLTRGRWFIVITCDEGDSKQQACGVEVGVRLKEAEKSKERDKHQAKNTLLNGAGNDLSGLQNHRLQQGRSSGGAMVRREALTVVFKFSSEIERSSS
jgi:hypothetical protein